MDSRALEAQDAPSSSGFRVFRSSRAVAAVILGVAILDYSTSASNTYSTNSKTKGTNIQWC